MAGGVYLNTRRAEPLALFAGILLQAPTGVRKIKTAMQTIDVFAFLTTELNAESGAVHPKAMPMILTEPDEIEMWMMEPGRSLSCSARCLTALWSTSDGMGPPRGRRPAACYRSGAEIAVADSKALAVRIEFAEVQEQLSGAMALSLTQLVMTPAMAEALGAMLLEQARMAPPKGQA